MARTKKKRRANTVTLYSSSDSDHESKSGRTVLATSMARTKKKRRANTVTSRSDTDSDHENERGRTILAMSMARTKKKRGAKTVTSHSDSDSDHEKKRGRTVLAAVRKAIQNGGKIPLEWNAAKVPCGEHRTTFGTYVGVVAREQVNINYEKWTHVPVDLVDEVYNDIAKAFFVLPDRRRWIVSRVAERWRAFKTRLVKKYLYTRSGRIRKKAPSKYSFILQSDWEKFTSYCTSDKFKEKSETNRTKSKLKTSKYRGGRLGYQHFNKEIMKDFEAQGIHIEKVPRHLSWLKAHKNKADESYAPGDMEIAEAIIALDGEAQKGEISVTGRDDILAKVLKKPEHGGRVRGVGSGITNKEYFGPVDRPKVAQLQDEIQTLQSQVSKLANMQQFMMAYILSCGQQTTIQFTPEQMKQFMVGGFGSGQSSGGDGQFSCSGGQLGGSSGQMGGVSQFSQFGAGDLFAGTGSRKCGIGFQNVNVPGFAVPSKPQSHQHLVPEKGDVPEPEIDHAPDSEIGH